MRTSTGGFMDNYTRRARNRHGRRKTLLDSGRAWRFTTDFLTGFKRRDVTPPNTARPYRTIYCKYKSSRLLFRVRFLLFFFRSLFTFLITPLPPPPPAYRDNNNNSTIVVCSLAGVLIDAKTPRNPITPRREFSPDVFLCLPPLLFVFLKYFYLCTCVRITNTILTSPREIHYCGRVTRFTRTVDSFQSIQYLVRQSRH